VYYAFAFTRLYRNHIPTWYCAHLSVKFFKSTDDQLFEICRRNISVSIRQNTKNKEKCYVF